MYGRYQGELQIVKKPLLADERVNVIGKVSENSIKLLDFIKEGTKFKFVGVEEWWKQLCWFVMQGCRQVYL